MTIALARSGYSAPIRRTVAAPIEWPMRIGFSSFIVRTNSTTSFTSVSPVSLAVNGSDKPCPRASSM